MNRSAERLVTEGIIMLEGDDAEAVKSCFELMTSLFPDDEALTCLPSWAQVVVEPTRRRRGFIVTGPNVGNLPINGYALLNIYSAIQSVADKWFREVCRVYELDYLSIRGTYTSIDSLAVVKYLDADIARCGHRDYSLVTVGMSNDDGLEIWANNQWKPLPGNTPYIHTGLFLQSHLLRKNIKHSEALHRVGATRDGRIFMGLFYDPEIVVNP